MTISGRHTLWLRYERRRNQFERLYKSKVLIALRGQVNMTLAHLREHGVRDTLTHLNTIVPFEGMAQVIKALYISAGLRQAAFTYQQGLRYKFGFGQNEQWTNDILAYFRLHLLSKAVLPITETSKRLMREVLEQAAREGWGVQKTVDAILAKVKDINEKRAQVIVRTESVRAMNLGSMVGANSSRLVMEKLWITAKDERVRSSHRRLDGVKKDFEDIFGNGCAFPGDPNGSAKETINCRCTLAFVPKRDENGRLIRKPTESTPMAHDTRPRFESVEQAVVEAVNG